MEYQVHKFMTGYVGCFKDDSSRLYDFPSRDHGWDPSDQTITKCTNYCKSHHYIYSGIEVKFNNRSRFFFYQNERYMSWKTLYYIMYDTIG